MMCRIRDAATQNSKLLIKTALQNAKTPVGAATYVQGSYGGTAVRCSTGSTARLLHDASFSHFSAASMRCRRRLNLLVASGLLGFIQPRAPVPSLLAQCCRRNALRLRSRASVVAVGSAASAVLWKASPSHAAIPVACRPTNTKTSSNIKSSPFEPAMRAFKFWRRVGPIVLHYKLTEVWFQMKGANADPKARAATWHRLHEMHAQDSLDIILELRGLFVKIGQVSLQVVEGG